MKKILIMPALAAALFAAACSESTTVDTTPRVRFLNATTGMAGSGGFTTNGQFASGSAVTFGQSACSKVTEGVTSFGFGAANASGTGLSGSTLATLTGQTLVAAGNYSVVAVGPAASPTVFMFDEGFSGTLGTNQAAVRFVNVGPGTETNANTYVVYKGAVGQGTIIGLNMAVGAPTPFSIVTSGTIQYSLLKLPNHVFAIDGPAGNLTLQPGTVNTVAILADESGGYQFVNLTRCS